MAWRIEYTSAATKRLHKLDREVAKRIADYMDNQIAGGADPRRVGGPLNGPLKRYWKYRVGDYRIICNIEDEKLIVLVVELGHRREVYR